jgi:hypothetical protein
MTGTKKGTKHDTPPTTNLLALEVSVEVKEALVVLVERVEVDVDEVVKHWDVPPIL